MPEQLLTFCQWFLLAGGALGSLYLLVAAATVREFARRVVPIPAEQPPVTVMKPLCGEEPELYDNLKSYCVQRYPAAQIVFGVQNPRDPAIALVRRLMADFPAADITLVVQPGWDAGNRKVANLENMLPAARHEVLIMADADIRVGPDYIASLVGALSQPEVGLVTCLYRGRASAEFWSRLAALHINHGFLPQAVVAEALSAGSGCFGATVAMRKDTLRAIGGFAAFSDVLADDHAFGEAVRALGLRVVLSSYLVDNVVAERGFRSLFRHELRWARTIRTLAPTGFVGSFVTHPLMLVLLANLLTGWSESGAALFAWVVLCRWIMARATETALNLPRSPPWLVPVRDFLSFAVFVTSFFTRTVEWRDQRLRIGPGGHLAPGGQPVSFFRWLSPRF